MSDLLENYAVAALSISPGPLVLSILVQAQNSLSTESFDTEDYLHSSLNLAGGLLDTMKLDMMDIFCVKLLMIIDKPTCPLVNICMHCACGKKHMIGDSHR